MAPRTIISFDDAGEPPAPPPPPTPQPPARPEPRPAPRPRGRWRRRLRAASIGLVILGLLAAGATLGWALRGWLPSGGVGVETVVVKRPVVRPAATAHGTLPNVVGLQENEARQAYADAGVDASAIVSRRVPYVEREGAVVEQQPLAATRIDGMKGKPTLLVGEPATMPDLRGVQADEARRRLSAIGVGATTLVRYDGSVSPGAVVRSRPAAGAAATATATLVVSEAPSSVDLSDLSATGGPCSPGQAQVGGSTLDTVVTCSATPDPAEATYASNAKVTGFSARLVLADGGTPGAAVRVRIREGSRLVATKVIGRTAQPADFALHGGPELAIEVQRLDHGTDDATVVLQDARITGARSGIDALAGTGP